MSHHSIRRTLLIRCGIGTSILMVLLSLSIYFTVRHSLYVEIDESLRQTASILANQMEYEGGKIIFEWQEGIGTNTSLSEQSLFQYWNEKNGSSTRSPALGNTHLPRFTGTGGTPDIKTITLPGKSEHARALGLRILPYAIPSELREIDGSTPQFNPSDFPHTLVVARDLTPLLRTLAYLSLILLIGTLISLGLVFLLIWHSVRTSLIPISTLTSHVLNRSENQLDTAIPIPKDLPTELTTLAHSFSGLLSRLSATRSREKDFLRHASHELRTPIASLSATTELALSKPRKTAEYIRHLESCAKTSGELNALVTSLTALARIGSHPAPPQPTVFSLSDMLGEILTKFTTSIAAKNLLIKTSHTSHPAFADPSLTRIILTNLLDNAISYSAPSSTISITLTTQNNRSEISFTNPSTDLPEDLERLFEPLFRRDPSRTSSSHLGIGLTLSREAASAMSATLTATRLEKGLIRFHLALPAAES